MMSEREIQDAIHRAWFVYVYLSVTLDALDPEAHAIDTTLESVGDATFGDVAGRLAEAVLKGACRG